MHAPACPEGGNPYPPHPGTRIGCYRCSLPGLTGFTTYRCEGTDTGHHEPFKPSGARAAAATLRHQSRSGTG